MDPPIINDWWLQYDYKPLAKWLKRVINKKAHKSVLIIAGPGTCGKSTIENFIKSKIGNVKKISTLDVLKTDQSRTNSGQLVNLYIKSELDESLGNTNILSIALANMLYIYFDLLNVTLAPLIIPISVKNIKDYIFPAHMKSYDITIIQLVEIPSSVRTKKYKSNNELMYWISGLHETKKTCIAFMCVRYFYHSELDIIPKDVIKLIAKTLFNMVKSDAPFNSKYCRNLQLNKK